MKKKFLIFITVLIVFIVSLLIVGGFWLYGYLGGFSVGFHNNRLVIRQYFCSDVCPENGGWHDEYFGVDTKEYCDQIGGRSFFDAAWGGFVGCSPK